jgi:1-hydroxycarotenoid 3,4-desaturase
MRQQRGRRRAIDAGPTVFTMRWVFDEILAQAGSTLDAELPRCAAVGAGAPRLARPRRALDLHADRSARPTPSRFAGPPRRGASGFCAEARASTTALEGPYIRSPAAQLL